MEAFETDLDTCMRAKVNLIQIVVHPDDDPRLVAEEIERIATLEKAIIVGPNDQACEDKRWKISTEIPSIRNLEGIMMMSSMKGRRFIKSIVVSHSSEPISKGVFPVLHFPRQTKNLTERIGDWTAEMMDRTGAIWKYDTDGEEIVKALIAESEGMNEAEAETLCRITFASPGFSPTIGCARVVTRESIAEGIMNAKRIMGIQEERR